MLGKPNAERPGMSWPRRLGRQKKGECGKLGAKEEVVPARTEASPVLRRVVRTACKLATGSGAMKSPVAWEWSVPVKGQGRKGRMELTDEVLSESKVRTWEQ